MCMHSLWVLVGALALLVTQSHGVAAQAYTQPGPCSVTQGVVEPLQLPEQSGCGRFCTLGVRLHLPAEPCPAAAPYPLVLLISGFQLSSSYYTTYAQRLASWGFAAVQYNLALFHIVADETEVGFLPYLLDHLSSHPGVSGLLNLTHIGVAGHSRGGKLAALHLAGTPQVVAAFLIDPVDSTSFTPPSPDNPSAVEALRGKNKQAAITGAGVSGPCNPVASNFHTLFDVLGPGSWLEVVPSAGHMQFANISSGIIARALDFLCHRGQTSHEHVIELTVPALVAWMDTQLRGQAAPTHHLATAGSSRQVLAALPHAAHADQVLQWHQQRCQQQHLVKESTAVGKYWSLPAAAHQQLGSLQAFYAWVRKEQQAGEITFEIKA